MAATSALIEDYFFVNDELITIPGFADVPLIPSFCITGPSVFKFELAANPNEEVEELIIMLLINGVLVAQAEADDAE